MIIKVIDYKIYVHDIMEDNCVQLSEDDVNTLDFNKYYEIQKNSLVEVKPLMYLDKYKEEKMTTIIDKRESILNSGLLVEELGGVFECTLDAINLFDNGYRLMNLQGLDDTAKRYVTTIDKKPKEITKLELKSLITKLGIYYDSIRNWFGLKEYQVMGSLTIEELNSIEI